MRIELLFPILATAPLAIFYALSAVTGDPMSAVVLGLVLMITAAGWLSGRATA